VSKNLSVSLIPGYPRSFAAPIRAAIQMPRLGLVLAVSEEDWDLL